MIKTKIDPEDLKKELTAHPEELNMREYGETQGCRTTYCIAGRLLLMAGHEPISSPHSPLLYFLDERKELVYPPATAAALLGLSKDTSLFFAPNWPENLWYAYNEALTPEELAQVACAAVDYFCKQAQ